MKSGLVWMDGRLVPFDQATMHTISPSMYYSAAVFEGIWCCDTPKGQAAFILREHLQRFVESIHILGINDFLYTSERSPWPVHTCPFGGLSGEHTR